MATATIPEAVYQIQAGNAIDTIRDAKTTDLEKLWERIIRYQDRPAVTQILAVRYEVAAAPSPDPRVQNVVLGEKTLMLALYRENEDSPWTEITPPR
jgi:hypothetical protein